MTNDQSLPGASAFRAPRQLAEPACVWPIGATLGEGLCWSVREQSLYAVDILERRLLRFMPEPAGVKRAAEASTRTHRHWDFGETISAVAERSPGPGLIVALQRGIAFFDPSTGALRRLAEPEPEPERRGNRFNDGKCDAAGRFWAGTMDFDCVAPTGALYRCSAGHRGGDAAATPGGLAAAVGSSELACERALDAGFAVTNGPTWSSDGHTMYFTDTVGRDIHAFDFDPADGSPTNPRIWLRFERPEDGKPDGMTTDAAGRIWVAHWGGGCVSCHEPENGAELLRVALPTAHITNVAFGGPNFETLYVSSARSGLSEAQLRDQPLAGGVFAVQTDAVGVAANLFAG